MDFLFPETERKISTRWTEDEIAEADEVVASIGGTSAVNGMFVKRRLKVKFSCLVDCMVGPIVR